MATYAIGDLQGCYRSLLALLDKIAFKRGTDVLWFVGDLVNRGPHSLECLRFVRDLGSGAICVLGNHDLHLLARAAGVARAGRHDSLDDILRAEDRDELVSWLRHRPLLHASGKAVLVHAGIPPDWSLDTAQSCAAEVSGMLASSDWRALLANMYGDAPNRWSPDLYGHERARFIINALTRMRVVDANGHVDLSYKGELAEIPAGTRPWFETLDASLDGVFVIAGHWSALGLHLTDRVALIDTGCVWGRSLTAVRLEDRTVFQVPSADAIAFDASAG